MTTDVNADLHPSTLAAIRDAVVLERPNPDDTNTEAVFDGDDEYALVLAVNGSTDATGVFTADGGGNNAKQVDGGTDWGNSQGAQSNNFYHDGSNYVVENQTGSNDQDYTVIGVAVV